ncbi:MAG: acylphosphatase [Candidatus Peribacteraceae bacterium]|nr:acylphosphatase [Candidatus Peribacteraceae bacterium]MDD5074644.1 acylphosphatase [Candidatus Peribacteraceae bacterium]
MPARHIKIFGLVQGVFFRARTQELANKLKLTGWVRNCENESVEIHAEGTKEALNELESWCHRGPPGARVESVNVSEVPEEHHSSFEVLRDGK